MRLGVGESGGGNFRLRHGFREVRVRSFVLGVMRACGQLDDAPGCSADALYGSEAGVPADRTGRKNKFFLLSVHIRRLLYRANPAFRIAGCAQRS